MPSVKGAAVAERAAEQADADPDEQLCFALYAASRAMTARYRTYLDELGLTYPQLIVMRVLWDQGEATVSEIGLRLRLDSGTLSPLLKRLEGSGLITRSSNPADERTVVIRTTARGRRLRQPAARVTCEIRESLDGLDLDRLVATLRGLEASLREG